MRAKELGKIISTIASDLRILEGKFTALHDIFGQMQEQNTALAKSLADLAEANKEMQAILSKAVVAPTSFVGGVPAFVSEDEQDLQWQLDNGLIDKKEFSDILRAAGFDNDEFDVEP